jgi:polyphosphate kinase 2
MSKTNKSGRNAADGKASNPYKSFDLDNPKLPDEIAEKALTSGDYPYDKELKKKDYQEQLQPLQIELLKLQAHVRNEGERIVVLLEGRDAAGKGGTVKAIMEHLNPRHARAVALSKPTETEAGQWYFQRYATHLPSKGDLVLFDRSWYNRAGVERVMGFCSKEQVEAFLREAPQFEGMLVRDGVRLFKFFLTIGREAQLERFHERRHDPLKQWKLTDIDRKAMGKWDEYTQAQTDLFRFTHSSAAPWTAIRFNDQKRGRLEAIRVLLSAIDYAGKDKKAVGKPDSKIVGSGPGFFDGE